MKYDMKKWLADCRDANIKKAIPILSFPGMQLIGCTVEELVKNGHLQALCMKKIADKYDTWASFSMMDLSVEAEAFGAEVVYKKDEVPTVHGALLTSMKEAEALEVPKVGVGRTEEYLKGIKEAKELITDRPIFAGIIGPYSLAGRLLDMTEIMILCYEEPEFVEVVLEKVTRFLISYVKAFKEAGADGIVMAEPAAGLLSPELMKEFSNPYVENVKEIAESEELLFIYHNCGNITPLMDPISEIKADVYSVGNAVDMEAVLQGLPKESVIIGNLDPAGIIRNGTPELIENETRKLLEQCKSYSNFIPSSGCDIPPATPIRNIDAFFKAVKDFYC